MPKILGREMRPTPSSKLPVLLLVVLLMGFGADVTFARSEVAQPRPASSVTEGPGQGKAGPRSAPVETGELEEHGLPQKAVEIARPFGFPVTNSMVVSLILARD